MLHLILTVLSLLHQLLKLRVHVHKILRYHPLLHLSRHLIVSLELLLIRLHHRIEVLILSHLVHTHMLHWKLLVALSRVVGPVLHFPKIVLASSYLVHDILALVLKLHLLVHVSLRLHVWCTHICRIHNKIWPSNLCIMLCDVLLDNMKGLKLYCFSVLWFYSCYFLYVIVFYVLIADLLKDLSRELTH